MVEVLSNIWQSSLSVVFAGNTFGSILRTKIKVPSKAVTGFHPLHKAMRLTCSTYLRMSSRIRRLIFIEFELSLLVTAKI